ncbi:hypothetical protein FHG87_011209 [Trinorchestia longiramus]|nr:hypothetical protein FHG87_011209 [Trinorchestia longiramus]
MRVSETSIVASTHYHESSACVIRQPSLNDDSCLGVPRQDNIGGSPGKYDDVIQRTCHSLMIRSSRQREDDVPFYGRAVVSAALRVLTAVAVAVAVVSAAPTVLIAATVAVAVVSAAPTVLIAAAVAVAVVSAAPTVLIAATVAVAVVSAAPTVLIAAAVAVAVVSAAPTVLIAAVAAAAAAATYIKAVPYHYSGPSVHGVSTPPLRLPPRDRLFRLFDTLMDYVLINMDGIGVGA